MVGHLTPIVVVWLLGFVFLLALLRAGRSDDD